MAQIKIYGMEEHLRPVKDQLSAVLHSCVVEAFDYPKNKRFHRFIYLNKETFFFPPDRSDAYTIVEISLFEGRSVAAKKKFYQAVFSSFRAELGIQPVDVEITLFETPRHNWGIRGTAGDELDLNYKIDV